MSADGPRRQAFDRVAYTQLVHEGPCFVCSLVSRRTGYDHQVLFEDADTIAFLSKYPTQVGYALVAPKRHLERLAEDLDVDEYLSLQRVVYRVVQAVTAAMPTERVYVLSLGSQQGNAHIHWHVVPLPPGVPYEQQQFHAVMAEHGVLDLTQAEQQSLADAIRAQL